MGFNGMFKYVDRRSLYIHNMEGSIKDMPKDYDKVSYIEQQIWYFGKHVDTLLYKIIRSSSQYFDTGSKDYAEYNYVHEQRDNADLLCLVSVYVPISYDFYNHIMSILENMTYDEYTNKWDIEDTEEDYKKNLDTILQAMNAIKELPEEGYTLKQLLDHKYYRVCYYNA